MTDFINEILTKLFFKPVGTDQFGNRYFLSKKKDAFNRHTRRVLYKGIVEPSKVPPMWNAWLRYNNDEIPTNQLEYAWQKNYNPNLTGTEYNHQPKGLLGKKLDKHSGQYNAWQPE